MRGKGEEHFLHHQWLSHACAPLQEAEGVVAETPRLFNRDRDQTVSLFHTLQNVAPGRHQAVMGETLGNIGRSDDFS